MLSWHNQSPPTHLTPPPPGRKLRPVPGLVIFDLEIEQLSNEERLENASNSYVNRM